MGKKTKAWPELGWIVKNPVQKFNKETKEWEDVLDSNGRKQYRLSFKINEDVTILYKGEEVSLNKGRTGFCVNPVEEVEKLYDNGFIDEKDIETRREKAEDAHKWLRYKVQLPPPRD